MSKVLFTGTVMMVMCFVGLLPAVTTFACGFENYPAVHFNSREPDFGAPPRSVNMYSWGEYGDRPVGDTKRSPMYPYSEEAEKKRVRWEALGLAALRQARRLEAAGRFEAAMPYYRTALKHGAGELAAIKDREELLAELTPNMDRSLLRQYLNARQAYELSRRGRAESRMKDLVNNPRAGILRAHALYVLGAMQYDAKHARQAAAIFEALAQRYPRSRRCEAALIMIPRSLLQVPTPDSSFKEWVGKAMMGGKAIERSRLALGTLLQKYPHSRFRQSALAWLARCDYLQGHRVAALEAYFHQYVTFTGVRESAAASVLFVSADLTPKEAKQLRADLRQNAEILGDYLEFRLEHGDVTKDDYQEYRFAHSDVTKSELSRLADLAAAFSGSQRLHLPVRISARLAEAQYLRGRYRDALTWSNRALSTASGLGIDLALYVRGATSRKTGKWTAAEADFQQLLREYPHSYLCGAARENLALLYERNGRFDLALDQYFHLGYQEDIAYLLDARMGTSQVAAYLNGHPRHPQRNLLIYTLGIRQLRDNQYGRALATLSRLPERTLRTLMAPATVPEEWDGFHNKIYDPRNIARELTHLDNVISLAREPNAKATALYAKASYLYNNRNLLFYNYALWQGERSVDFSFYWNTRVATRSDQHAAREYHYAHECLYRVRTQCLAIAKQYKQSPEAPKALYRAACASHELANFDYWWRKEAPRLHLADDSVRLMQRVFQQYPNDPLAKSVRKFAKVFAEENKEISRNTIFEVAMK